MNARFGNFPYRLHVGEETTLKFYDLTSDGLLCLRVRETFYPSFELLSLLYRIHIDSIDG